MATTPVSDAATHVGDADEIRDSASGVDIRLFLIMRIQLISVAVASLLALGASPQSTFQQPAVTPVGIWRGTSVCLVRPSACNDEIVVYRITQMKPTDSLSLDARKIVRGEEQEMGVLACRFIPLNGRVTCAIPQGRWHFSVRGDSLVGELRLRDNTKYRDVRAVRAAKPLVGRQ